MNLRHEGDYPSSGCFLDGSGEFLAHRHLELLPSVLHALPAAVSDQRPFGRCVDVFKVNGQVVALIDDPCCACAPSVAVTVEPGYCCTGSRDRVVAARRAGHDELSSPAPEAWRSREGRNRSCPRRAYPLTPYRDRGVRVPASAVPPLLKASVNLGRSS